MLLIITYRRQQRETSVCFSLPLIYRGGSDVPVPSDPRSEARRELGFERKVFFFVH